MIIIPVTDDGDRRFIIDTGADLLSLRTYYSDGEQSYWLLDIHDINENPLITGIALVPGADNILKSQGDILEGYQLYIRLSENKASDLDALGKYLHLILYLPGEENPHKSDDPLMLISWPDGWH